MAQLFFYEINKMQLSYSFLPFSNRLRVIDE